MNQTTPAINKEVKPLLFEVKISIKLSYMYLSGTPDRNFEMPRKITEGEIYFDC